MILGKLAHGGMDHADLIGIAVGDDDFRPAFHQIRHGLRRLAGCKLLLGQ
jgi:hypothetical protein